MSTSDELLVPAAAQADPASFELLRVWVANKGQHITLRTAVWKDPAAWGVMLADLARHVASAYAQEAELDEAKTLHRIKAAIDAELGSPTDKPTGRVQR